MWDPNPMYVIPGGVETRWACPENRTAGKGIAARSNGGRKGSPFLPVRAKEQVVLAQEDGTSGTIRRIWVTLDDRSPRMLRSLRLDFYWDGAERAAVSAPLGDFFGTGLGRIAPFQSSLFSSPEGRSLNCAVPMPFRTGMKMVLTNEGDTDLAMFFYEIDYTVGDRHSDDALYFHAHFRRERPTSLRQDYEIVPRLAGRGRFLGANIGVMPDAEKYGRSWWGEGECKLYLDGDEKFPSLCSTGTEDYIGTGWEQGTFSHLHQGCHVADKEAMAYCFYRYHVPDPVYFRRDIRVTMQQIGYWDPLTKEAFRQMDVTVMKAGEGSQTVAFASDADIPDYGNFERQDDWSSCAYFYLDSPYSTLPELTEVDKRVKDCR
ncbi:glycoside hydrolase family 172 protein [Cohnella sp.]|uniref:glycoside hydrolase family 172 protein n=1 Tax=Cohnella sp. TaxID=1883426 RepID=UPI00356552D1